MATITLNLSSAAATRIAKALQETLNYAEPATPEEIKDYITANLKQIVRTSEHRAAAKKAKELAKSDVVIT